MSDHFHVTLTRQRKDHIEVTFMVVRAKYIDQEGQVAYELGYERQYRKCGDPACLGGEPFGRLLDSEIQA